MSKQEELEMWFSLFQTLRGIPNDVRTMNHSAYIREVGSRVYDLADNLDVDQSNWNTDDESFFKQ